jgi:hypothetical protein
MKFYIKENTRNYNRGFYVIPDEDHYSLGELIASENNWTSITGLKNKFRNHKTAREAISHLHQVVGKKLRRLKEEHKDLYGYPTRYVYSD